MPIITQIMAEVTGDSGAGGGGGGGSTIIGGVATFSVVKLDTGLQSVTVGSIPLALQKKVELFASVPS